MRRRKLIKSEAEKTNKRIHRDTEDISNASCSFRVFREFRVRVFFKMHMDINLNKRELGGGTVESNADGWRLALPAVASYADAQLDDTGGLARNQLAWMPPVRFSVEARASHPTPSGTFGFGLWNDPFSLSLGMGGAARKLPALPQTAWFFYMSPPGDLPLDPSTPGSGWKAATLRSTRMPSWLPAPIAVGGAAFIAIPILRRPGFALARRFYQAKESALRVDPSEWHAYGIEWSELEARFYVDGSLVLRSAHPPSGPLGLVLWIDNQYAIASPERGFGFGVLPLAAGQFLELRALRVEALPCA
jgi:hypothetical protein